MSDDLDPRPGDPVLRDSAKVQRGRGARERGRVILAAAITAVLAVFAVLNLDQIPVDLVVSTERVPLIIIIAASALLGLAIGYIAGRRRS
jgi:uncharacterized integral membrane protein